MTSSPEGRISSTRRRRIVRRSRLTMYAPQLDAAVDSRRGLTDGEAQFPVIRRAESVRFSARISQVAQMGCVISVLHQLHWLSVLIIFPPWSTVRCPAWRHHTWSPGLSARHVCDEARRRLRSVNSRKCHHRPRPAVTLVTDVYCC